MAYKNTCFWIQLASILIAVNIISCAHSVLSGTKWKYVESATKTDSLFSKRNIEIEFVNTNRILLHNQRFSQPL